MRPSSATCSPTTRSSSSGWTTRPIARYAERGEFVTRDGKRITDARTLAGQIGLAKTMRKYDLRRIISFHGRVKAAREFSAEMPDVIAWMPARARPTGALWSDHVSGAMTSGRRDRLLLRFRDLAPNERGLLSNARCLGEGVDVPSIDGVAFIDPRRSTIDIVQALGRAIRKSPDKKVGTIVLPVFISDEEDPEQALDESAFKHVWDVLKALRAHDEALGEELDELRRRLGARRCTRRGGRARSSWTFRQAASALEFVEAFNARLVEQTTASWEFCFGLLERFVEREGHSRVPQGYRDNGYRLGAWLTRQRQLHRQGNLPNERACRLERLPDWAWDPHRADWEEGLAQLLAFVQREGHAVVPAAHTSDDGFSLGAWVNAQRTGYTSATLDSARRERLEAVPGWTWETRQVAWDEGFIHLMRFVEREGHARVRQGSREEGYRLGGWVAEQRQAYREETLAPQRRARLEALPGWTWDTRVAAWEEGFASLQRFVEREGHARVRGPWREDGFSLGKWVGKQRQAFKEGRLESRRRERLEALPGMDVEHAGDSLGTWLCPAATVRRAREDMRAFRRSIGRAVMRSAPGPISNARHIARTGSRQSVKPALSPRPGGSGSRSTRLGTTASLT